MGDKLELSEENQKKADLIINHLLKNEASAKDLKKLINGNDDKLMFLINNLTEKFLIYEYSANKKTTIYGLLNMGDL